MAVKNAVGNHSHGRWVRSQYSRAETKHVRPPLEASGLSLPEGGGRVGAKALCPGTLEGHSPLRTTGLK